MTRWRWLSHFGHGAGWHRGRDTDGRLVKLCDTCQKPVGFILGGAVNRKGPAETPADVLGKPSGKARRVTRGNVAPWKVSNR